MSKENQLADELHQRASKIMTQAPEELRQTPISVIQQLIHDQSVHDIELENRIQELQKEKGQLEESRRQCLDLFDFAPTAYFNLNRDGVIINANFIAGELLHTSRLDLINKRFSMFVEPAYQKAYAQYLQNIVETGQRERIEIEIHGVDGSRLYTQLQTVVVPDNQNVIYRTSAINTTQRKMAEEALQESEERFRKIFESSPIGIELYDAEGKLVAANEACLAIFGVSSLEMVKGFSLFEDPNVTDEVKIRLRHKETVRWNAPFDFELVKKRQLYTTSRSGIIFLDVLVTPLYSGPDILKGYLIQLQDITEREQIEHDLNGRIRQLNCLYRISTLFQEANLTKDQVYQGVVELIPPAWQYPEITCARAAVKGKVFKTTNYRETSWKMSSDITSSGTKVGFVEVAYLEEKPSILEGPFSREERDLLDTVAEQLAKLVER